MATERYHRQLILKGFGPAAQQMLSEAKVLVIGAGGIGCPALMYLAAAGVGQLGIADHDTVEITNLQRQIIFSEEDIGKQKVEIAKKHLEKANGQISLIVYPVKLVQDNILEIIAAYDFILDGTDTFESRYLINDACALLQKTLIFAAVSGFEGQLAVFANDAKGGGRRNYRDIFPVEPKPGEIKNCSENGILGTVPGVIGTLAASEIIKHVTGIGNNLSNKILHYNLLTMEHHEFNILSGNGYTLPETTAEFMQISYGINCCVNSDYEDINWKTMLELADNNNTLIIDVREYHEIPVIGKVQNTRVPMAMLGDFINHQIDEENIILVCQHGLRSTSATELLLKKYGNSKKIYNLRGGLSRWIKEMNGNG